MPEKLKKLTSTVSSKGQVTIPKQVRVRLGLIPGSRIRFELSDGAVRMNKVPTASSGIWEWVGYFGKIGTAPVESDSLKLVARLRGRSE